MEDFINENYDAIYEKYSAIYPEKINSDFYLEDVNNLDEFINEYMKGEYELWKKRKIKI